MLLGRLTSYCAESSRTVNVAALDAIMKEWTSASPFATRVGHLLSGGGLNGTTLLNTKTASNDEAIDLIIGGGGFDWFLASGNDWMDRDPATEKRTLLS
jgi:hypothetical protein